MSEKENGEFQFEDLDKPLSEQEMKETGGGADWLLSEIQNAQTGQDNLLKDAIHNLVNQSLLNNHHTPTNVSPAGKLTSGDPGSRRNTGNEGKNPGNG